MQPIISADQKIAKRIMGTNMIINMTLVRILFVIFHTNLIPINTPITHMITAMRAFNRLLNAFTRSNQYKICNTETTQIIGRIIAPNTRLILFAGKN